MTGTVAVTGATGFIGGHVVRRLADAGWRVRVLARRLPVHPETADLTLDIVIGSLDDEQSLAELVRGADAVVHCAGLVKASDPGAFHRVNAAGTVRLVAAAAAARPAPRFLLVSSLAAREPAISDYALSKRAGEEAVEGARSLSSVILRPPAVYGPGDRELLPLFRCAARGLGLLLGPEGNRLSLVHVGDLAGAVAAALAADVGPPGSILEIDDGRPGGYSWHDLVALAGVAVGRRVRPIPVPAAALRLAGAAASLAARFTGRPPMLGPGKIREIRHPDWVCRDGGLRGSLPWRPTLTAERGFALTVEWYRRNGWL